MLTFGIDIPKKIAKNENSDLDSDDAICRQKSRMRCDSKYIELDFLGSQKSKDRLNKLLDGRFMNPEILSVMSSLFLVGAISRMIPKVIIT